jgi:aralkylamine N-acetyltransferase
MHITQSVQVGFPTRDPVKLQQAIECAHTVIWIRCSRQSRWARKGQLLGIARATSDGALTATIWDVAVHPAWQRIGLGRALMERIVQALCKSEIEVISLYAEPAVIQLYEKLGFQKDLQVHVLRGLPLCAALTHV